MKELTREEINWIYDKAEKQAWFHPISTLLHEVHKTNSWKERNKYKIESEFSDLKDEAIRRINLRKIYEKEPDAPKVCALLQEGKLSYKEIADRFDLYECDVLEIAQRKTYRNISEDYEWDEKKYAHYTEEIPNVIPENTRRRSKIRTIKHNDETIKLVCQLIQDGLKPKEIAHKCGVSETTVYSIRNGNSHKDISKNYKLPKSNKPPRKSNEPAYKYKYKITTDSPDNEKLKRIIVNGVETNYVSNNLGTIWDRTNWKVVTAGKKFDIYGEKFNETYELKINGKFIGFDRDRIVASLFLPVPDKYKHFCTRQMRVYKRKPRIESFHYINSKTGEELFDYSYLTEKNLTWGL